MAESETVLIELLKQGDESAFRQLVEQSQHQIYNTCLGFVRNEDDADDLTQEVFIEVFRSINSYRGEARLSTWMYRIAVTKSLEFLRSKKRKKRFAVLKSLFSSENDAAIEIPHFDHPGVLAENRERARVLFQAIEKLPESQKIAYTLNKIEDLSYGEISKVMKRSVSSIESLLHRAKSNLQNYLKNYYHS